MSKEDNSKRNKAKSSDVSGANNDLRSAAEALITKENKLNGVDIEKLTPEEVSLIIHDLKVHQVELEMQNEELKRIQIELDSTKARYFDIYDLAPVGYLIISERGIILESNLTASTMLGTSRADLIKTRFSQYVQKEDEDIYYLHRKKIFKSLLPQECELRIVKNDGTTFWGRIKASVEISEELKTCRFTLDDITERKRIEEEQRSVLEQLQVGIAVHAADSSVIFCNPLAEKILGFSSEQLKGKVASDPAWKFYNEEGKQLRLDEYPISIIINSKKSIDDYVIGIKSSHSDSIRWVAVNGHPIIENGQIEKVIISFIDITDKKVSEKELIESELKYRLLITQMKQGMALHEIIVDAAGNPVDYRFLDVNQGFENLTGLKREDVIGKTVLEVLPGTEHTWIEKYGHVALTGEPLTFEDYAIEMNKHFEIIAYSPKPKQFATIFKDITKKKKDEELFEQNMKDLLESQRIVGLGTWRLKLATNEVSWTEELYKMYGFDPKLPPPPYTEHMKLFTSDSWNSLSTALERTATLGIPYELELETVKLDGSNGWMWVRGEAEKDSEGNIISLWGAAWDITEQKKLEEEKINMFAHLNQQQRLESIGTLAGGVAHEINNPLNGIMNYGQLILDSSDGENSEYAKEIVRETNRIAVIVKDLLQFSRDEKKEHSYANIKDIIENTLSLIKTVIKSDQINLQIDIPEDMPDLKCRSQQIQQVIMNLLTNARDALIEKYEGYNEDKIIKLYCTQFNKENRRWVRITIEDHGNGIPEASKGRIFEPFFSSKSRDRGTGLGLYISYVIVKDHHGELTFETEEGIYTKFYVDLPIDNGLELG